MKAALLIVLSLSALAFAGPAVKQTNQIDASIDKFNTGIQHQTIKQTQTTEALKQWCFASQLSQTELTASFKKLVGIVKASPEDLTTEQAVMSERICQEAQMQKAGEPSGKQQADVKAHELIKDVYMDSLIACESRECMKQLIKIINSNKVDSIRASYYMTRIAVTEKSAIKGEEEVKQLAESFVMQQQESESEAIERQKLFAVTSLISKSLEKKQVSGEMKQTAEQVAKTICERYIEPISQQEVEQYKQQDGEQQQSFELTKKIAKRNAALKALANLPAWLIKDNKQIEQILIKLVLNKNELSTVRQSAIECLEQNENVYEQLKQVTFDQQEPIEVRVAAYRAIMTIAYSSDKDEQTKQQIAQEIVSHVVKHCEQEQNQQQDDQFCLYAISHLDNLRTSQQPEYELVKECIVKNKQHYMQIQLLVKKFKHQLADVRKSSRNYKLEQEFNQMNSGLIIEGDIVYESKKNMNNKYNKLVGPQILPKLVRVNMSMPIIGETVNVVEITLRQSQMDEEMISALKLVSSTKFNSETVTKVVESFKSSVEQQQQKQIGAKQQSATEADLTIKVEGCTVVYMCLDDIKSSEQSGIKSHERKTRSTNNIVDDIIEYLKREPVAFNRGFNFNINQVFGKGMLDVDANLVAGLRFESRATGQSAENFEIVAQVEPRFAFEAVVGPAKMSSKKLLQRVSTKTAFGLRLRFKQNELLDCQIDLPMNTMELFTVESQMVEKSQSIPYSYNYLPESIYGQVDIYSQDEEICDSPIYGQQQQQQQQIRRANIFKKMQKQQQANKQSLVKSWMSTKQQQISQFAGFAHSIETPEEVARATGLRAKLRVVASPQEAGFLAQCIVRKYDTSMQGYRVQVEKQTGTNTYQLTVSTPGSRTDRTMQMRVQMQSNGQRTLIKSDVQSPMIQAVAVYELVHDGRQYAVKCEVQSQRAQWRHSFEAGVQRGSQSQSGRIATTYKPYLSVDSSELKRPIQMQGVVSYQQSPKTVINYELTSTNLPDVFIQGKTILAERQISSQKRANSRRAMQSPIELLLSNELTLTNEFVAKTQQHAVKVNQMIDWDASKWALHADMSASHEIQRKQVQEISCSIKVDQEQQMFTVQRVVPQKPHKQFRCTVQSDCKQQGTHQLIAELRYNAQLQSVVAYKHKLDYQHQKQQGQVQAAYLVELISSEHQFNEKVQGRTELVYEPRMNTIKSVKCDMQSRQKLAKLQADFASQDQHQIEFQLQTERVSHRTSWRNDKRQVQVQSRTEQRGQLVNKCQLNLLKQQGECQIVVEQPSENLRLVADLKLNQSGRPSSVAFQSGRFQSKAEFTFEPMSRTASNKMHSWARQVQRVLPASLVLPAKLHLKTDLKDSVKQQAYWLESQLNQLVNSDKSFFRFDSPLYRTDLEFDPRDSSAKFGLFARQQKQQQQMRPAFSTDESLISELNMNTNKLGANKLWMLRSLLSTQQQQQQLKNEARRALFEYADRRQQHKHSINWQPADERVQFQFERQPSQEFGISASQVKPMRASADLATSLFATDYEHTNQQQQPCTIQMESDYLDLDAEAKPFDGQDSYVKVRALSRHPRSAFKKHESEFRYNKHSGYKAHMKHEDAKEQRHQWQLEADQSPKKWTKMSYESDRHGKGQYEHNWRKHTVAKRSSKQQQKQQQEEQYYKNQIAFESQSPSQLWSHRSELQWDEPIRMVSRPGRSVVKRSADIAEYLKNTNARLVSQTSTGFGNKQQELYKLDFDYQPSEQYTRLNVNMPNDMLHSSQFDFQPSERLYKLQSKLVNRRTNEPSYQLMASTSLPISVADSDLFLDEQHPMIERPIQSYGFVSQLFKQPLKLDYSDKFGRQARLDYDELTNSMDQSKYQGLRQKRAALYFKDDASDIEHQSTYDFYPEAVLGFKPTKRVPGDLAWKTETKYGPVVVRADSSEHTVQFQLQSPIVNAKLTGETPTVAGRAKSQLIKLTIDNKQQSVQLAKIVRKSPILASCPWFHQLAKQIDQSRFEHQTELLVSIVDTIFKIKSQTHLDQRPVMLIEGELNQQSNKCVVKINGERVQGQLMLDLMTKSASLAFEVDNKRSLQHQTRLVRVSDEFFSLDSMTTYHQKPVFKVQGKISAMLFTEPQHLFQSRSAGRRSSSMAATPEEHISTFDAVVYEPTPMQVQGQFDCLKKEARMLVRDMHKNKQSDVRVHFDDQTDKVYVDARTTGPQGIAYSLQKTINVAPFVQVY